MRPIESIPIKQITPDPDQPRKVFSESELVALGQNMLQHQQQVPIIVYEEAIAELGARRFLIADGERRWRAAQLVEIDILSAIVLKEKPSKVQLMVSRASIDLHRASLRPNERADMLVKLVEETGQSVVELATLLNMSQSFCSKHLALSRLVPAIRAMLDAGEIDIEKAYLLSQEPDHAKQAALASAAATLSREQFRQKVKGIAAAHEAKATAVRLPMPGGFQVSLHGRGIDFDLVIEVLGETIRMLKKGKAQGLTLASQVKVMADTAKATRKTVTGGVA